MDRCPIKDVDDPRDYLCPGFLEYARVNRLELLVDASRNVWEKGLDPWHPDAFKGCGKNIEEIIKSGFTGGDRKQGWHLLDFWGNSIGYSEDIPNSIRFRITFDRILSSSIWSATPPLDAKLIEDYMASVYEKRSEALKVCPRCKKTPWAAIIPPLGGKERFYCVFCGQKVSFNVRLKFEAMED